MGRWYVDDEGFIRYVAKYEGAEGVATFKEAVALAVEYCDEIIAHWKKQKTNLLTRPEWMYEHLLREESRTKLKSEETSFQLLSSSLCFPPYHCCRYHFRYI